MRGQLGGHLKKKKEAKVRSLICNTFPWVKNLRVKNKTLNEDR